MAPPSRGGDAPASSAEWDPGTQDGAEPTQPTRAQGRAASVRTLVRGPRAWVWCMTIDDVFDLLDHAIEPEPWLCDAPWEYRAMHWRPNADDDDSSG